MVRGALLSRKSAGTSYLGENPTLISWLTPALRAGSQETVQYLLGPLVVSDGAEAAGPAFAAGTDATGLL